MSCLCTEDAAEQNLARLDDVIGQLAGQMEALKRQSRQAVRYRALSQQIRKLEQELGVALVERTTRKVSITALALYLASRVTMRKSEFPVVL